jgi:hypothetical protein
MKLQSEEKIYKLWDKYLEECKKQDWLPTKNLWLCRLGNISRETYRRWKIKSDAIKTIDKIIEQYWVQRLKGNNVAGAIFYLKNAFHYRDRTDHDITSGGKPIPLLGGDSNGQKNSSNRKTIKSK